MANHNIKFTTFRSLPDLGLLTESIRSDGLELIATGMHIHRFKPSGKPIKDSAIYSIDIDQSALTKAGQQLLDDIAIGGDIRLLRTGIRMGPVKPGQMLFYIYYGVQSTEKSLEILQIITHWLQEKLPFSVKEAYSSFEGGPIRGDIVAMNRSTLREIIAHD